MKPEEAYTAWKTDPTPDNLHAVVRTLDGPVNYALYAVGDTDNPQLRHQARLYAADAVKTYDPTKGTQLGSWVSGQLQSLRRFKRENTGPVRVPERAQLDAWHLEKTRRTYLDNHGVDPDVKQLADASHLSVKRISDVRKSTRPVVSQDAIADVEQNSVDFMDEALEYVYGESDATDRQIIERLTGYGGTPQMAKHLIAQHLGVSPSQITRRSERIAQKLQAMEQDLREVVS